MSRAFRKRSALHGHELHFGPNMTPMVDVVMVILIFFMASASFAGSEWFLRTAIPRQAPAAQPPKQNQGDPFDLPPARFELTLRRGADGRTVASGEGIQPVGLDGLRAQLAGIARGTSAGDLELIVRSDGDVPYGDVIRAHDAAAAAGIAKVGLMDTGPDGGAGG
jgi:biopolymer transport protein ExbD